MIRSFPIGFLCVACVSFSLGQTKPATSPASPFPAEIDKVIEKMKDIAITPPPAKATSAAMEQYRKNVDARLQVAADTLVSQEQTVTVRVVDVRRTAVKDAFHVIAIIPHAVETPLNELERAHVQEWQTKRRSDAAKLNAQKPKTEQQRALQQQMRQKHAETANEGMEQARRSADLRAPMATVTLKTADADAAKLQRDQVVKARLVPTSCKYQIKLITAGAYGVNLPGQRTLLDYQREGKLGKGEEVAVQLSLDADLLELVVPDAPKSEARK